MMLGKSAFLAVMLACAMPAAAQGLEPLAGEAAAFAVHVLRDGGGAYTLRLDTKLRLAPDRVGAAHMADEGHARPMIDGKPAQPAGDMLALKGLAPGAHRIEIALLTNDGRPYASEGKPLNARLVLGVPRPGRTPAPAGEARRLSLAIAGGKIAPTAPTHRVTQGELIELFLTSDAAAEVHLHGYDLEAKLAPGAPVSLIVDAGVAGRFPLSTHGGRSETTLAYLEVYPR